MKRARRHTFYEAFTAWPNLCQHISTYQTWFFKCSHAKTLQRREDTHYYHRNFLPGKVHRRRIRRQTRGDFRSIFAPLRGREKINLHF